MRTNYEQQKFTDEKFPIRFHTDRVYFGDNKAHEWKNIKNNLFYEIPVHWHEGLELWRIKSGNPCITIDTNQFYAKVGDVIVINSNQIHVIRVNDGECVYEVLGIAYHFCKDWGFLLQEINFQNLVVDERLSVLFDKINEEFYQKKDFFESIILSSCLEMLGLLSRMYKTDIKNPDSSLLKINIVRQMTQYIAGNFSSQQILSDLSKHIKYSSFYLSHIFAEFTGTTLKEYQMQIRLQFAKKMLAKDKMTIYEIARECGYNNANSFTVAFKKMTGNTPAEYRKNKQKKC